jgi:hypothetical protein
MEEKNDSLVRNAHARVTPSWVRAPKSPCTLEVRSIRLATSHLRHNDFLRVSLGDPPGVGLIDLIDLLVDLTKHRHGAHKRRTMAGREGIVDDADNHYYEKEEKDKAHGSVPQCGP